MFRAIAGIWPFGAGQVGLPRNARILFLPQRAYLPIGTLRDVIAYPVRDGGFSDENVDDALSAVGLQHLHPRLNEQQNWSMQLSPGEQQRVAFARAVLLQPAWLFLDEATSSLDENAEQELYRMVKERLRQTTILSIGHRSSLQDFHSRTLELKSDGHGSRVLTAA